MAINIGPKIKVDGEAEYRRAMRDIIAQTKALDSEMRLLTSSFDKNTSKEEKSAKTSDVLTRKITAQEQAVAELEKQLAKAQQSYGAGSYEVQSYQQRLNEAKAELNDTRSALENLDQTLDETSDNMGDSESAAGGLADIFKGGLFAGLAKDAISGLAGKLKEFAKESVQAAAEVKALSSSWSQTFGGLGGTANEAIDRVSQSTGIMAERLKQAGMQIYAFNKASGGDSVEALGMMERALTTAADLAAYYDKSVEDTTESLLSFLKGNYANDAALGISSTEYTRNAKAAEMFGTEFKNLTEVQKQSVLLQTVEDAAKLSGAMGQAAREADAWENVQGNLNEAWKQFEAAVGTPILQMLIPILQGITAVAQDAADALRPSEYQQAADSAESFVQSLKQIGPEAEATKKDANDLADEILGLSGKVKAGGPGWDDFRYKVQRLNDQFPGLNLQIDENTGAINLSAEAIRDFIEASSGYEEYTKNQQALAEIEQKRAEILEQLTGAQNDQTESMGGAARVAVQTATNSALVSAEMGKTENSSARLQAALDDLATQEAALNDRQTELAENGYAVEESADAQAGAISAVSEEATNYIAKLAEVGEQYQAAYENALSSIQGQQDLWKEFNAESEMTVNEIVANWQKQAEYSDQYAANMAAALARPIDGMRELVASIDDGSAESAAILETLANGTEEDAKAIIKAFDRRKDAQENMARTMQGAEVALQEETNKILRDAGEYADEIVNVLKNPDQYSETVRENMEAYRNGLTAIAPDVLNSAHNLAQQVRQALSDIQITVSPSMAINGGRLDINAAKNGLNNAYNRRSMVYK